MERTQSELFEIQTGQPAQEGTQEDFNEQYKNTPIWIRGNNDIGYFATLGDSRITEHYRTWKKVENLLDDKDWNLLLTIITQLITEINNYNKKEEEKQ